MNNIEKIRNDAYLYYASSGIHKENIRIDNISVRYYEFELDEKNILWTDNLYIPIRYIYMRDKCLMLFCLNRHKDLLLDVIKKFQDNLFSQKCIDYIYSHISDDMRNLFNINVLSDINIHSNYGLQYAISEKSELNLFAKQNTTINFDETTKYDVICKYIDVQGLCYGTLIDDKIVSLASWNGRPDDGIREIGVGTHEDYRNRGYAISNVVAIAEDIINAGKIAIYNTFKNNIVSQKTAIAAGLSEIGKVQMFWFKKE